MNIIFVFLIFLLQLEIFSTEGFATTITENVEPVDVAIQECTEVLVGLKTHLKTSKQKLYRNIRPNVLSSKLKKLLLPAKSINEKRRKAFEVDHIHFLQRITSLFKREIKQKKMFSKSDTHIIQTEIAIEIDALLKRIKRNKAEYFLKSSEYQLYKKMIKELQDEFVLEAFDEESISYKNLGDLLKYHFFCKPLNGTIGLLALISGGFFLNYINESFNEKKVLLEEKEKLKKTIKSEEKKEKEKSKKKEEKKIPSKTKPAFSFTSLFSSRLQTKAFESKFEIKKITSVSQGKDGVANCGAHAMFHAECFLEELETNKELKPTRENFVPFWQEYLTWAKNLPSTGIFHEKRDIKGDYISSDIVRHYFRNIRNNKKKKRVHILEYGRTESGVPDLTLIEESQQCPSSEEVLRDRLDDESIEWDDLRNLISEWDDLLSGRSKEPIIAIISNGGHWIAAQYEYDVESKKIKISLRDSSGESTSIAQKPAQVMLSLGEKLKEYKDIIDHPTEKIIIPEYYQVFSDYLLALRDSSNEEKLNNPFIKELILLIKLFKANPLKKVVFKQFTFKTKVENKAIAFDEKEFKRDPLHVFIQEENGVTTSTFKFQHEKYGPPQQYKLDKDGYQILDSNGNPIITEEYIKQESLPLDQWIETRLLQPLFKFALEEAKKD